MKKYNIEQLGDSLSRPALVFAGLLLLAFVLYGQVLSAPFVYDDHELLLDSPLIKSVTAVFHSHGEGVTKLFTFWTFALNYFVGGINPFGYHLVNILLHACNAWFLYLVVRLFFRTPRLKDKGASVDLSASFAAIIFLCHPLQTESVSYIWQRSELLNAFFYFLCVISYIQGRCERQWIYFFLTGLFFCLGFISKGMIITFPILAILLEDALFDIPRSRKLQFRFWGMVVIILELWFVEVPWIHDFLGQWNLKFMNFTGTRMDMGYFYTQLDAVGRYVLLALFPVYQNLDHNVPFIYTFWNDHVVLATLLVLSILVLGLRLWKNERLAAIGIFWFFIALIPGFILGGRDPMAEHRLYFALGGLALSAARMGFFLFQRKQEYIWVIVIFIAALSVLTLARNHLWASPRLLLEDTVRKSPTSGRPAMILGSVYISEKRFDDAAEMFQHAILYDPKSAESYNNLGMIYWQKGHTMEAEEMFEKAIAVRKNFAPAYINLGYFALNIGDDDRAEGLFIQAKDFGKKDTALVGLANVALSRGQIKQAEEILGQALRVEPRNLKAYLTLSRIYQFKGDKLNARLMLEKAKALE